MNPMKVLSLLALLVVAAMGNPTSSANPSLKPSHWLKPHELEAIPSVDDLTLERLERMSLEKGSELLQQICKYLNI